ncbi:hypothetical protein NDA10_007700 [Ustilago hordei]|uniref:Elongin-A n=1 Tax=Ustilago hordei TaxID=120017 RepID=I2FV15_USTHO|nr:uncharacterized protein UHO2_06548 [Ustilago hordei]KAJ1040667.1 hypothetical protein NDA10_007700 [Ustilago hordei]CCF50758.1 uncharacterized protein UHOR_06336 [Ustilago hordei]SYW77251.1 uncharacterized protein UHO2_06548 [Ustilago hordei]
MKDWKRSPEPPGMMGLKDTTYKVQGNWGQPEELDFDPASPLPGTCPTALRTSSSSSSSSFSSSSFSSSSFSSSSFRNPHPPPSSNMSLYSMCLRVILRNISSVQDLGEMPYRNAKPILEECRVEQLVTLEEASPHLLEHTEEVWKRNCLRDFNELRKKYTPSTPCIALPKEPKSWRRLYFRTKGETEQAKLEAAKRIKDKYVQHRAEKEAKKLVVSDRPLMVKNARSAGRRFGLMAAGGGGGGGVSKGQSLMNKARSGSVAQAKLTAPRGGRPTFKGLGRSKMLGAEIAPEAAGAEVRSEMVRPMVAPRRIEGGGSEGLAKLKKFSMPMPGSDGLEEEAKGKTSTSAARSKKEESMQRVDSDAVSVATGLPRLKPHEVAAAAPLTPSCASCPRSGSVSVKSRPTSSGQQAGSSIQKAPPASSSPPPDIARVERRKLDFFGSSKPCSSPSSAATAVGCSSSPRPSSPLSCRLKRTHSSSSTRAPPTKQVASPPTASSPTATSFAPFGSASGKPAVKVIQAKRVRTQEKAESPSSPRPSSPPPPPPEKVASPNTKPARPATAQVRGNGSARPISIRHQSNSFRPAAAGGGQDSRMVRASPAALSSIFAPSRPASRGAGGGGSR